MNKLNMGSLGFSSMYIRRVGKPIPLTYNDRTQMVDMSPVRILFLHEIYTTPLLLSKIMREP